MVKKMATFMIQEQLFGIDSLAVSSLEWIAQVTPIPQASPDIVGLVYIRGQLVTLFDPSIWFFSRPSLLTKPYKCLFLKPLNIHYNDTMIKESIAMIIDNEIDVTQDEDNAKITVIDLKKTLSNYVYRQGEIHD